MKHINLERFDAAAFDLEGTLADTIPIHHAARKKAFEQHGYGYITPAEHALGPTYGSLTTDIIGTILLKAGAINDAVPFNENPQVQEVIATKSAIFKEMASKGFDAMPGAIEFLEVFGPRYLGRLALVTSSAEQFVLPFIERYRLQKYFPEEHIISQDTVVAESRAGKPAPDPYLMAMQQLMAHNLLVFEDTVSGVESAKTADATVIALAFEKHNAELFNSGTLIHPPDAVVDNYSQARELLKI